jgi:hypothetical protein
MRRFSKDDLDLLAAISRRIWLRRSSLVFEGVFTHPNVLYKEAKESIEEFKRCTPNGQQFHHG